MSKIMIVLFTVILLMPLLAFSQEKGRFQFVIEEISYPSVGVEKSPIMTKEKKMIKFDTATGEVWTFDWIAREIDGKMWVRGEWSLLNGSMVPIMEKGKIIERR